MTPRGPVRAAQYGAVHPRLGLRLRYLAPQLGMAAA